MLLEATLFALAFGEGGWERKAPKVGVAIPYASEPKVGVAIPYASEPKLGATNGGYGQNEASTGQYGMGLIEEPMYVDPAKVKVKPMLNLQSGKNGVSLPEAYDARAEYGKCIQPIRNQGVCGSCWAFSTVEAFAFRVCIDKGEFAVLSAQELVSCVSGSGWPRLCDGGNLMDAGHFLTLNGVRTDRCIPYMEADNEEGKANPSQTCSKGECYAKGFEGDVYFGKEFYNVQGNGLPYELSELRMMRELVDNGPFPVAMNADSITGDQYKGGIHSCTPQESTSINHAITLVGYGTDISGLKYWTLQNSWGDGWGEGGYFRINRAQGTNCAIGTQYSMSVGTVPGKIQTYATWKEMTKFADCNSMSTVVKKICNSASCCEGGSCPKECAVFQGCCGEQITGRDCDHLYNAKNPSGKAEKGAAGAAWNKCAAPCCRGEGECPEWCTAWNQCCKIGPTLPGEEPTCSNYPLYGYPMCTSSASASRGIEDREERELVKRIRALLGSSGLGAPSLGTHGSGCRNGEGYLPPCNPGLYCKEVDEGTWTSGTCVPRQRW